MRYVLQVKTAGMSLPELTYAYIIQLALFQVHYRLLIQWRLCLGRDLNQQLFHCGSKLGGCERIGGSMQNNHSAWAAGPLPRLGCPSTMLDTEACIWTLAPLHKAVQLGLGCLIKWRWCAGIKGDSDDEGDGDGDEEDNSYLCVHYTD